MRRLLRHVMVQNSLRFPSLQHAANLPSFVGQGPKNSRTSRETKSPANATNTTLLDHHSTFSPVNHLSHRLTNTCNHVSLHSWSSQRWPVQARLPKVRFPSKTQSDQQVLTIPLATTQRMAPSFATSTHAVPSPRPSRLRLVPMAATRLSSTTCRK
jgi:hypothetical protein